MSYLKFFLTNLLLININDSNVESCCCCTALSNVCCDPKFYGAMCILYWLFVLSTNIYYIFMEVTPLTIISIVFNTIWYLCSSCFIFRPSNTKKIRRAKTVLIILDSCFMIANGIFCSTVIYMYFSGLALGIYPFDTIWINLFLGLRVSCTINGGTVEGCDINKSLIVIYFFLLVVFILFKFIGMINIFHHISTNKEDKREKLIEENINYPQENDFDDSNNRRRSNTSKKKRNSHRNESDSDDNDDERKKNAPIIVNNYHSKEENDRELRKTLTELGKKIDKLEQRLPQNIELSGTTNNNNIERYSKNLNESYEEKNITENMRPSEFKKEDIE